eukprot:tig00020552_g10480.t1
MGALISRVIWKIFHFQALRKAAAHARQAEDARRIGDLKNAATHAELAVRLLGAAWAASRWPIEEQIEYGRLLGEIRLQLKDGAGAETAFREALRVLGSESLLDLAHDHDPDPDPEDLELRQLELSARLAFAIYMQGQVSAAVEMFNELRRKLTPVASSRSRGTGAISRAVSIAQLRERVLHERARQAARSGAPEGAALMIMLRREEKVLYKRAAIARDELGEAIQQFMRATIEADCFRSQCRWNAALEIYDRLLDRMPGCLPAIFDKMTVCLLIVHKTDAALELISEAERILQDARPGSTSPTAQETDSKLKAIMRIELLRDQAKLQLMKRENDRANKFRLLPPARAIRVLDSRIARLPPSTQSFCAYATKIELCMNSRRYAEVPPAISSAEALLEKLAG